MKLDKLNRGSLLHKIEKIEDKLELRKKVLKTFQQEEQDFRINYNSKFRGDEKPTKKDEFELSRLRDVVFSVELDIFLMEKQIELIKNMIVNNEVTEFQGCMVRGQFDSAHPTKIWNCHFSSIPLQKFNK